LTSVTAGCEHGQESHDGTVPSLASAPEASRAWLLIEHPGPWPHEPAEAELPAPLRAVAGSAVGLGIRVQLIRRPGPRREPDPRRVFVGWTAGSEPWLRHGDVAAGPGWPAGLDLSRLAGGEPSSFGRPAGEPVFLVCGHGQRNACCARLGVPLARQLAARYPGQVFQTTHVGGHRFAANLVILPHGLYYGPVGLAEATAAISAYQRGAVTPERYRGRAGQPQPAQRAEHARLARAGSLAVAALA
jgi:Sucrase/ferredoxin-like